MVRDKEKTKARILAAVGKLLARSGFRQLGVNAIAREAGVDKVLIYRYFKGLPTLLEVFGREGDYWPTLETIIGEEEDLEGETLEESMVELLLKLLHELNKRPITQEILRWELLEGNELTQELAKVREETALETLKFLENKYPFPPDTDIPAMSAVVVSGVIYLMLRSKVAKNFFGMDLQSKDDWERIERAAAKIFQTLPSGEEGEGERGSRGE